MADERTLSPEERRARERRRFLTAAAGGTAILALGCYAYLHQDEDPRALKVASETLPDGRKRLPPGQHLIKTLRPMGCGEGKEGDPNPANYKLQVYGEVEKPFELSFAELLALPQTEQTCDVHCVTRWSVVDAQWTGVRLAELAERAKVKPTAKHVIFETAGGYTSNVPLDEALRPTVLVAHQFMGEPLRLPHGPPVRALVPHLYFWKSAKWLIGIRFNAEDEPGFWETRGYHNHADPWREERFSA